MVHYNIQSLLAKVDKLQMELSHFDVIALSETWLSPDIKGDKIFFRTTRNLLERIDLVLHMVVLLYMLKIISPVNQERTWMLTDLNLFG